MQLLTTQMYELAQQVATRLVQTNNVLTTAESCTGGLIASLCTELSGSSAWCYGGVVSYDNKVKEQALGVQPNTLATYGAVSQQTVEEMATGGLHRLCGTLCVAVSGVAGPSGGTPQKPVGTVWVATAFAAPSGIMTSSYHNMLSGNRQQIRAQAVCVALHAVLTALASQ